MVIAPECTHRRALSCREQLWWGSMYRQTWWRGEGLIAWGFSCLRTFLRGGAPPVVARAQGAAKPRQVSQALLVAEQNTVGRAAGAQRQICCVQTATPLTGKACSIIAASFPYSLYDPSCSPLGLHARLTNVQVFKNELKSSMWTSVHFLPLWQFA